MDEHASALALESLRSRITRVLPAQIRAAVTTLTEEQLWWRPNESANSVANIVLHVSGSLNHFLNRALGGFAYDRDRVREFAERRPLTKAELLAVFDEMVSRAEQTFAGLSVARLSDPSPEPKMQSVVIEDLISIAVHLSTHTGQIVWIAKSLQPGALDDVWIHTHRELGGWNPAPR